jgi:hypothetical protein
MRNCLFCTKELIRKINEQPHSWNKRRYCNRSCAASSNNRTSPKRGVEGACKQCLIPLATRLSYCSIECQKIAKKKRLSDRRKAGTIISSSQSVGSWMKRTKIKSIEYKGGGCIRCGYSRYVGCLHFHHIDPTQKDFGISGISKAWDTIRAELDKCVLLCSICHSELHGGLWKLEDLSSLSLAS